MTTRSPATAATTAKTTLYRGGVVHSPAHPFATALVVAGDRIAWIGSDEAAAGHADGVDAVVGKGSRHDRSPVR